MLWSHDGVDGTRVAARQVLRAVTISLLSRAADFSGCQGGLSFISLFNTASGLPHFPVSLNFRISSCAIRDRSAKSASLSSGSATTSFGRKLARAARPSDTVCILVRLGFG